MRSLTVLATSFLLCIINISAAVGQAPSILSFQGYLEDPAGIPIDTPSVSITFKLYDGGLIWTEHLAGVGIENGIFDIILGETNSLASIAFDDDIQLGITVGGDSEISPRTPLAAAAYARALPGFYTFFHADENSSGYNVIGGDRNNVVGTDITGATIGGGGGWAGYYYPNSVLSNFATVGGGLGNTASGGAATVGGGLGNTASGSRATVGGGQNNTASGQNATVGGGVDNTADHWGVTVGGGLGNTATHWYSTIGGGLSNTANGDGATVPGGFGNRAQGAHSFAAGRIAAAIHDGTFVWNDQSASDTLKSTDVNQFLIRAEGGVAIGTNIPRGMLTAQGPDDPIMGPSLVFLGTSGNQVEAGRIRFLDGISSTNHRGAYIHYNASENDLHIGVHDASDDAILNDEDIITIKRENGMVGIKRPNPSHPLHVGTTTSDGNGAHVSAAGVWTSGSSRTFKEDLRLVDNSRILQEVLDLPVYRYRYKGSDEGEHMGPVAEDFFEAFELGNDERYIGNVDGDGVALAAIKGLYEIVQEQKAEIERLREIVESGEGR